MNRKPLLQRIDESLDNPSSINEGTLSQFKDPNYVVTDNVVLSNGLTKGVGLTAYAKNPNGRGSASLTIRKPVAGEGAPAVVTSSDYVNSNRPRINSRRAVINLANIEAGFNDLWLATDRKVDKPSKEFMKMMLDKYNELAGVV